MALSDENRLRIEKEEKYRAQVRGQLDSSRSRPLIQLLAWLGVSIVVVICAYLLSVTPRAYQKFKLIALEAEMDLDKAMKSKALERAKVAVPQPLWGPRVLILDENTFRIEARLGGFEGDDVSIDARTLDKGETWEVLKPKIRKRGF